MMASLFISGLFLAIFSCVIVMPAMIDERNVFYRDMDMNLVHPSVYVIVFSLIEIPFAITSTYNIYIIEYYY